jgi:hypothetical protein
MDEEPISTRIVWAVADDVGVDPTDLPPLHDEIDTEALDTLVDGGTARPGSCTVRFTYADRVVRVTDGDISLEAATQFSGD